MNSLEGTEQLSWLGSLREQETSRSDQRYILVNFSSPKLGYATNFLEKANTIGELSKLKTIITTVRL